MKTPAYIGAVLGVVALIIVAVHADFPAMLRTLSSGGPAAHVGLGYVFWPTTVRDAVDRLLPVASVGGSVVGVRILQWRASRVPSPEPAASSPGVCRRSSAGSGSRDAGYTGPEAP
jgi:hypothetical protein